MTKTRFYHWLLVLAVICGSWATAAPSKEDTSSVFDQIDLLVDVRHEIVSNYVEKPDQRQMVEHAVRAMVDSLDDRYTVFLTPEELEPFDKQIRGTFSGIGAEIDIFEDRLRIVSPLEDSPAWKSGVMAGDVVLEIDGESTQGITVTDAVKKLTGPEGTQVAIKVRHPSGKEETLTITRAVINVETVRGLRRDARNHWEYMIDPANRVGYIRITQFSDNTADGVRKTLDQLLEQNMAGLILDLRFNPGGLLESAVQVSDFFLDGGKRIVSVKGRSVPERAETSTDPGTIPPIPMVVLANEASASRSEIVTGALADNQRAKFIGTRTFGKGSVQQVKMLESGHGAAKLTHAYYYLPNGRNIHRREGQELWGVDPEDGFYVPMDYDQVQKMVDIRRDSPLLRPAAGDAPPPTVTPGWIETDLADPQLAAGLRAVLGKLETDQWPTVGQSGADELVKKMTRDNLLHQRELLNERLELVEKELAKLDKPEAQQPETEPSGHAATTPADDTEPSAGSAPSPQEPAATQP